jgi:hypothetical protein
MRTRRPLWGGQLSSARQFASSDIQGIPLLGQQYGKGKTLAAQEVSCQDMYVSRLDQMNLHTAKGLEEKRKKKKDTDN